ncbi:hypothetical protein B0H11DRAFT_1932139 [Mycena galericulata]|nr:hypothetical protein B0H11DRAFT_1932139 [Mycena galericulata]
MTHRSSRRDKFYYSASQRLRVSGRTSTKAWCRSPLLPVGMRTRCLEPQGASAISIKCQGDEWRGRSGVKRVWVRDRVVQDRVGVAAADGSGPNRVLSRLRMEESRQRTEAGEMGAEAEEDESRSHDSIQEAGRVGFPSARREESAAREDGPGDCPARRLWHDNGAGIGDFIAPAVAKLCFQEPEFDATFIVVPCTNYQFRVNPQWEVSVSRTNTRKEIHMHICSGGLQPVSSVEIWSCFNSSEVSVRIPNLDPAFRLGHGKSTQTTLSHAQTPQVGAQTKNLSGWPATPLFAVFGIPDGEYSSRHQNNM